MAHDSKKRGASSFSAQQPQNKRLELSKIPDAKIEEELEAAIAAGDNAHVLEILDVAPRWMKRQPEYMLLRASALLSVGDDLEALRLLLEIERKNPRFTALYLPLAMFYSNHLCPAHALQAAKRAQSDRDLDDDSRALLSQIVEEATETIQHYASELGLSFEAMQRTCILDERAQIAMEEYKLSEVDYFCREAIKIAPNWNPPHNRRAQALFFLGRVNEAIAISQVVLAREAKNVFALCNLVLYHLGLDQAEQAREYAARLGQLYKKFPVDSMEIEQVITALALVEDTDTLWKIARPYLKAPEDSLSARSWLCLAVAAIRSGKWKDAHKLLEKAGEEELPPAGKDFLDELKTVETQWHPRLAWMPPAYPSVDMFLHPKVMAELGDMLEKFSGPLSPSQKRRLDGFFQKYPFIFTATKRLLWDKDGNQMALQVLGEMDRPDADAEILRFALSQAGSREARLQALTKLVLKERYAGPMPVKIWDEDQEEWRDVELNSQHIGEIEPNARPETIALLEKARKTKDMQEAISLLQAAVEMEPTSPIALFNLGVMLIKSGKTEEGEAFFYRSVEVDPTYTYGHASIALSEADQGHEQEAIDHLRVVGRADVISPDTAVIANMAWLVLALQKHDLKTARQRFEMAAQIYPDHHLLEFYEKKLKEAENFEEQFGFLIEYRRKSIQRTRRKLLATPLTMEMNLLACLETNTKEMLVGSAYFLRMSPAGKKGELASRLAENLLDPEFLQQMLDEYLEGNERETLKWMLETGGVRPWEEFVQKYGDDMNESVYWNYHDPQSISGRLRMSGLFYSGMLEGQPVAFIPADVRPLMRALLK
jgi:tetratricopeptide (TPR) repeat protein